jgi:hypothetical protein
MRLHRGEHAVVDHEPADPVELLEPLFGGPLAELLEDGQTDLVVLVEDPAQGRRQGGSRGRQEAALPPIASAISSIRETRRSFQSTNDVRISPEPSTRRLR